ncbi:putative fatty acyl-CoA reductase CG5065 isoform X2 [Cimex lectularius]|nr:putative fatty acyl-CoA reductase CG5065 isoform X2 [Cimex lectularius]XP_014251337.1 putative fatty acyl-CoA reductase CG5065 isoform X2 [Cimex lectularius]XP_014251338.1 putative fatty acyl-CoA reductase CG5065 isoform X2 [Cimex lectularius]
MSKDGNNNRGLESTVQSFYEGGSVLVTGATGFVGKALVEKLLRSCPGLETIFLLIRTKKGASPQERLKELLQNKVFDRVRDSGCLQKVCAVAGDVMEPGLGLSEEDKTRLVTQVTVVFHSAATVKFNETLHDAVKLNTMGTQAVIDLCKEMQKLQAVVHVSTAYSNANRTEVDEKVYPPPANPDGIMQCVKHLSPELVESLTTMLLANNHPNTYTITKAMAESIVSQQADILPISIVRPSIVTAAWQEPFPGWVDNISGITGIMMEIGRGTIRSIICDEKYLVDIIPVDIVVDSLIVAAWHTANFRKGSVPVYNCTSGSLNPIYWHELGKLTLKHSLTMPSKYQQWYPGFSFTTNRFKHNIKDLFLHTFPAFITDVYLRIKGSKPMNAMFNTKAFPAKQPVRVSYLQLMNNAVFWSMLKLCQRFRMAARTGEFFALHEWQFCCNNQKALDTDLSVADKVLFHTDVAKLGWDEYIKIYMSGIRRYILKDSPDTLKSSLQKLNRLLWFQRLGKLFCVFILYKLLWLR